MPIPVPIELLCSQLDIKEIQPLQTVGYEGGLITDRDKCDGVILVNAHSPEVRRRFTIAHELAHFLMPSHMPSADGRFLCSQQDMFHLATDERDQRRRMEAEANRFASRILLQQSSFGLRWPRQRIPTCNRLLRCRVATTSARKQLGAPMSSSGRSRRPSSSPRRQARAVLSDKIQISLSFRFKKAHQFHNSRCSCVAVTNKGSRATLMRPMPVSGLTSIVATARRRFTSRSFLNSRAMRWSCSRSSLQMTTIMILTASAPRKSD